MKTLVRPALALLAFFTVLTGLVYPAAVTAIGQVALPAQASGSLLRDGRHVAGSALVGQPFDAPEYFWGRPSATGARPYDAAASAGSNLGPTNPTLRDAVAKRLAALRAADPQHRRPVPVDLVTTSGSGLDPDITPAAALYQVPRVAGARGLGPDRVRQLVQAHIEGRALGVLGEPHVNVLGLNRALDRLDPEGAPTRR